MCRTDQAADKAQTTRRANNIFFLNIFFFSPSKWPEISGQILISQHLIPLHLKRESISVFTWVLCWNHSWADKYQWLLQGQLPQYKTLIRYVHIAHNGQCGVLVSSAWLIEISCTFEYPHRIVLCVIWVVSLMLPLCNIGEKGPKIRREWFVFHVNLKNLQQTIIKDNVSFVNGEIITPDRCLSVQLLNSELVEWLADQLNTFLAPHNHTTVTEWHRGVTVSRTKQPLSHREWLQCWTKSSLVPVNLEVLRCEIPRIKRMAEWWAATGCGLRVVRSPTGGIAWEGSCTVSLLPQRKDWIQFLGNLVL